MAGRPAPAARRIPGEQGTWVFVFGDMLVFGVFFGTFLVERSKAPVVFDAARKTLHLDIGLLNTLVLLTSSLLVVAAVGGIRTGARSIAAPALLAAIGCGVLFVALKVTEYALLAGAGHRLTGRRPRDRRGQGAPGGAGLHGIAACPDPAACRLRDLLRGTVGRAQWPLSVAVAALPPLKPWLPRMDSNHQPSD